MCLVIYVLTLQCTKLPQELEWACESYKSCTYMGKTLAMLKRKKHPNVIHVIDVEVEHQNRLMKQ